MAKPKKGSEYPGMRNPKNFEEKKELPDSWGLWRRYNNKAIIFACHGSNNDLGFYALTEDGHVVIVPKHISELPKGGWEKASFPGE